jgi:hypothetical protein
MSIRYSTRSEGGGDWAVIDLNRNGIVVASGLSLDEADETAKRWNDEREKEVKNHAE